MKEKMNSDLVEMPPFGLFGLEPDVVRHVEILRRRPQHTVYAVEYGRHKYVLKWFKAPEESIELYVYKLLQENNVPTLPVHHSASRGLLLEDLRHSDRWRLAGEPDGTLAEVGAAVAAWYRILHQAGFEAVKDREHGNVILRDWVSELTPHSLAVAGKKLGLDGEPGWLLAVDQIELLKAAFRALPQTFNYNDFAIENLALSRDRERPLQAIVFDYDQFAIGPVYSDWRNVTYSLGGDARYAFIEAYGPINEVEKLFDDPLSTLYALVIASRRPQLPTWAKQEVEKAQSELLERQIRRAIGLV